MNPTVLLPAEAADYLRVSPRQLRRLRREGGGPRFQRWGPHTIRYLLADLDAWIDAQQSGTSLDDFARAS